MSFPRKNVIPALVGTGIQIIIFTKHISSQCHSCESRNPGKHWIPPYQVLGKLGQARNDKPHRTYVGMYISKNTHHSNIPFFHYFTFF